MFSRFNILSTLDKIASCLIEALRELLNEITRKEERIFSRKSSWKNLNGEIYFQQ